MFFFRAGVEDQVKREEKTIGQSSLPEIVSGNDEVDYEQYLEMADNPIQNADEVDYDSDGIPIGKGAEKAKIEPLPPVDHSKVSYPKFRRNLYSEHPQISALNEDAVSSIRSELEVSVMGSNVNSPIQTFVHAGFHSDLLKAISKAGYEKPTPIQAQALPVAMAGRDIIGLAKTGSGKTLSFVW